MQQTKGSRWVGARSPLTGPIVIAPPRWFPDPSREPLYVEVIVERGASWLGIAPPSTRLAEPLTGRVLDLTEPLPAALTAGPARLAVTAGSDAVQ